MNTLLLPRFFVSTPLVTGETLSLPDDVVRHMHVLRLQAGDSIILFNGAGGQFEVELVELDKRSATARIGAFHARDAESPYHVTLAQGIAGGDKMDWLIEKAVELGAASIVPLTTVRSVVRLSGERAARRHTHWQALVRAACEQCGRNRLPEVAPAREIAAWLGSLSRKPEDGELRLLLSPRADLAFSALPSSAPKGKVTVMVGPEGGFSAAEEAAVIECGFTPLGLGPRVLRTETAGIAVLAALAARWGGW
jgi:16S rRNA (uracil1498-N3)-methyltransferase